MRKLGSKSKFGKKQLKISKKLIFINRNIIYGKTSLWIWKWRFGGLQIFILKWWKDSNIDELLWEDLICRWKHVRRCMSRRRSKIQKERGRRGVRDMFYPLAGTSKNGFSEERMDVPHVRMKPHLYPNTPSNPISKHHISFDAI